MSLLGMQAALKVPRLSVEDAYPHCLGLPACRCSQALDMAVRLMLKGEVCSVRSSWQYSYQGRQDVPQVSCCWQTSEV